MTPPSKPLDDPIDEMLVLLLNMHGVTEVDPSDLNITKLRILKWRSDYVMGELENLLKDSKLVNNRCCGVHLQVIDRLAELRKLKEKGE